MLFQPIHVNHKLNLNESSKAFQTILLASGQFKNNLSLPVFTMTFSVYQRIFEN